MLPARGILEVPENVAFWIVVTIFYKNSVTLHKKYVDCSRTETPDTIIACDELEPKSNTEVNAVHYEV